jgi:Tfp pilus assembly protein PilF
MSIKMTAAVLLAMACSSDPNYADSYLELAQVLTSAGQPEKALGVIEKAIRLNPHYPSSSLGL